MSKVLLGLVGETNVNRSEVETAFVDVQELLNKADVLFGHLEITVSDNPTANAMAEDIYDLPYKKGWVHSKPEALNAWKTGGFSAVGVASNVSGSAESSMRIISELDELGIPHAGIGVNIEEARKPAIIEKNGVKFGFLSYTSVFYPQFVPAQKNRPGAATIKAQMSIVPSWRTEEMPGAMPSVKTWLDESEKTAMLEDIANLRPLVDHVILSCHWGVTDGENAQDYQIELAHAAIDAGVDVIMGHHAHRPQGIEVYKGKPIFYSMGNFAFDWWFVKKWLKEGIMAFVSFEKGVLDKISFVPVRRSDNSNNVTPLALDSQEGIALVDTIRDLSKRFSTVIEIKGDEVVISC